MGLLEFWAGGWWLVIDETGIQGVFPWQAGNVTLNNFFLRWF
jgi:hypothetical protein